MKRDLHRLKTNTPTSPEAEIKSIMKNAVDKVFTPLWLRD